MEKFYFTYHYITNNKQEYWGWELYNFILRHSDGQRYCGEI